MTGSADADLVGVVLTGGQSRRMGRDKAFVPVDGVPMVARVLAVLSSVCRRVIVVTKTPDAYSRLDAPIVVDERDDQAPLVGVCTGLRAASVAWTFVAACDLPYLHPGAVRLLAILAQGYDAAVPRVRGRWHPLHAVYGQGALASFEACLERGERRMGAALEMVQVRAVGAAELKRVDPSLATLWNINTPRDLGRAAGLRASFGSRRA